MEPTPKQPWEKFFTRDYMTDGKLQKCSLAEQGLWMRMLCLMWTGDRRGYLESGGEATTPEELARAVGADFDEVSECLAQLERRKVFSRDGNGVIYSRRIIADDLAAEECRTNGSRGGNPNITHKTQRGVNPPVKGRVNPPVNPPVNLESDTESDTESDSKTDTEGDQNQNQRQRVNRASPAPAPPTLEEVKLAAAKGGLSESSAIEFWSYWESRDWMRGKDKMRRWTAALMGWKVRQERYDAERPNHKPAPGQPHTLPNGQPDLSKMCPSDRDAILLERRIDRGDFD